MRASNPPAGKPPASLAPTPPSVGKQAKQAETAEDAPPEIKKEANPFTEGDWHMIVNAWFGLAVRVVLVVGAVFSVYQFLVAREETRIQRALEMVQLWEQPEYQEAQRAVRRRIDALNTKYADLLADQQTASTRSILRKKIGLEAMTPNGEPPAEEFQEQFDRVVYFLNRVSFCVEGGLCSRDVIDAYFRDYANSFWEYFSDYAGQQRKTVSATYAKPIEAYVLGGAAPKAGD